MIALFAIRSLLNPTTSHLNKALIVIGVIAMMSAAFLVQQSGFGMQTFSSLTSFGYTQDVQQGREGREKGTVERRKLIRAVTWNIAAVNNNPFEYWITNNDPNYDKIMSSVSSFIDNPGDFDVPVSDVFTDNMFEELVVSMTAANWTGIEETRTLWNAQYREKKIISQFIKDGEIGRKRLTSMPDRVTNTINTVNEGTAMRPSVVNCYNSGDLSSVAKWWEQWRAFMFDREILIKRHGVNTSVKVRDMITKIRKSKYPSITTEEERISIPLQTLCAAIFDSILIAMMNKIDSNAWQPLRNDMCNKLNRKKSERTMEILENTYGNADIQFLQEVATSFVARSEDRKLSELFDIYYPASMDSDRDQNSFILLKKGMFSNVLEVTADVFIDKDSENIQMVPASDGDLLVLKALKIDDNTNYILASFHGDTNGLATIPIVTAIHKYSMKYPEHKLLFGLDANTYYQPEKDQQGMSQFANFFTEKKINSCYGQTPNPKNFTTFHARTHLQPQLNKAVRVDEKDQKWDKNPKDFILFFESDFTVFSTVKDNTGERKYIENMVFPTLTFPSDHGITSTVLVEISRNSDGNSGGDEKKEEVKQEGIAKEGDEKVVEVTKEELMVEAKGEKKEIVVDEKKEIVIEVEKKEEVQKIEDSSTAPNSPLPLPSTPLLSVPVPVQKVEAELVIMKEEPVDVFNGTSVTIYNPIVNDTATEIPVVTVVSEVTENNRTETHLRKRMQKRRRLKMSLQ